MLNWAMTIVGVIFVVSGIVELIKGHFIGGVVSLVIGVSVLVLGWTIAGIVLLILGILIIVKGVIALIETIVKRRKSIAQLLFPVITIVVGAVIAFGNGLDIAIMVGGILLIVDGIIGIIAALR
jgi:uncharacterized membrane protein HdeD (DUF308 family)